MSLTAYPPKALVRRSGMLGDVILATPLLRELRRRLGPEAQIDVLTGITQAFANNPHVGRILAPNQAVNLADYSLFVNLDLAYERRPKIHVTQAYGLAVFGHLDFDPAPEIFLAAADRARAQAIRDRVGADFVVVHARNHPTWPSRNLPARFWADTVREILERTDYSVIMVGQGTDLRCGEMPRLFNVHDALSLQELTALIGLAQAFVGVDSGIFHAAACTNAPIVGLFTSAHQNFRKPLRQAARFIGIDARLPCYGCQHDEPAPIVQYDCRRGSLECLSTFRASDVVDALRSLALAPPA